MHLLPRVLLIFSLIFGVTACAFGQSRQAVGMGTITGRVTVGGKPAQGITVVLRSSTNDDSDGKTAGRATTDAEGQYRLLSLAAGRYLIAPVAPAYFSPENQEGFETRGKVVNLAEGDAVENIDFTLARGGVITGRVTDADGRAVISEPVTISTAEQNNNRRPSFSYNSPMFQTDDRGVYRIYGIPPGRYLVSVGQNSKRGMVRMGVGRGASYPQTFHPGVSDESRASVIEVTEGSEATNIDIPLGRLAETYAVRGTVVDAETGKPVPNARVGYGAMVEGEKRMGAVAVVTHTDPDGRFSLNALTPGRYAVFAVPEEQSDSYGVPTTLEINEGDVTGLVVKMRRGVSVSGVAVVEGTSDRAALAKLSQLRIAYFQESEGMAVPVWGPGERVNADGSFQIRGLRPGKVRLSLGGWPPPKGFSLLRVERDGVEQRGGVIEVQAGNPITGLRLIIEYGTGVLRGQVRIENGTLPEGAHLYVNARRPSVSETSLPGTEVDARGRFVLEGLPPGEYQLRLSAYWNQPGGSRIPSVVQNVSVREGVETAVTIVLDLNAKDETGKP
jgi:protocatechuate 3,4-dioxygenase beta subunit